MSECPDAFHHGPPDGYGRCPWCRKKVTYALERQHISLPGRRSTSEEAYDYFYDPDFGSERGDEYTNDRPQGR